MLVEAFGVEAGDLIILAPVIDEHLAASIAVRGEAMRPCSDVGRVQRFGYGSVVDIEAGGVP